MAFNHYAWERPPNDRISAELFLMSYSPSRWILDFHTAVGSRRGWVLQNHAQVQPQIYLYSLTWPSPSNNMNRLAKWLTKLVGWHFNSFLCLCLCPRLWRFQWFAKWWKRRKSKRGLSVQNLDHQNSGNHNLPPPLHRTLNASEHEDITSYS